VVGGRTACWQLPPHWPGSGYLAAASTCQEGYPQLGAGPLLRLQVIQESVSSIQGVLLSDYRRPEPPAGAGAEEAEAAAPASDSGPTDAGDHASTAALSAAIADSAAAFASAAGSMEEDLPVNAQQQGYMAGNGTGGRWQCVCKRIPQRCQGPHRVLGRVRWSSWKTSAHGLPAAWCGEAGWLTRLLCGAVQAAWSSTLCRP
jgi:hypothetical protein